MQMQVAVILAGGRGTKMWPYSEVRPKALIPILNQPVLGMLLKSLRNLNTSTIIVTGGYLGSQVEAYVSGQSGVTYVDTANCLGTAYALKKALAGVTWDECLVVYGDIVVDEADLKRLVQFRRDSGVAAAALVTPIDGERPGDWICASVQGSSLKEVIGHPRGASHRMCGIYAITKEVSQYIWSASGSFRNVPVGMMPPVESEIGDSIQAMIEAGVDVGAVETQGYFVDLDKPWHILEATMALGRYRSAALKESSIHPTARISDKAEIKGHVVIGENSVIGPRTVINGNLWVGKDTIIDNGPILGGGVVIGDGCIIDDYCKINDGSVVGNRCKVRHGAELSGVIMDNVYLYHYMIISGVVGVSTDIGGGTMCGGLRFDDGETVHVVKGRKEIPKEFANAVYIGDYCRTGIGAMIMPGCKIGSYSIVGSGVILYDDLPSRTMVLAKQEIVTKPWGPEKYGW
ncbi:MAG: NTP transferase domain-containing protein [Firmicutes bacterium]|nr:NTP transferase domain-containing protein [Bacillota bacterium]